MQISLESIKEGLKLVTIEADSQFLQIYPPEVTPEAASSKVMSGITVFTGGGNGRSGLVNAKLQILSAGEYEHNGIFVSAQSNYAADVGEQKQLDLLELEAEGIRCVYYASGRDVEREQLAQIGVVELLLLQVQPDFEQQLKAINAIDPQILIPVANSPELLERFKQQSAIPFEQVSRLKVKASDFQSEDYIVRGVELG